MLKIKIMKSKLIIIALLLTIAYTAMAGNTILRHANYPSGSRWVSNNGKFDLVYANGYLIESEITAFGKIQLWQYPDNGKGVATQPLSFWTIYEDYDDFWGTGNYVVDSYTIYIGGVRWDFMGTASLIFPGYNSTQAYPGRAGSVVLKDDGNMYVTTEASQGAAIWTSATSPAQMYGKANYHACAPQGRNLYFPRPFKDEFHTVFFASAVISMREQCKISQASAPVTFSALQYVELLPGFETAVTGTGAVILQPAPLTNAPAPARRLTQPAETPPPSNFSIYPNPANSEIHIAADPGDKIKVVTLFDNAGKLVGSYKNQSTVNIINLPAGMYLYKVQTEKNSYTGKIIKE
jgi:Secretion system C-terminal sorting domain